MSRSLPQLEFLRKSWLPVRKTPVARWDGEKGLEDTELTHWCRDRSRNLALPELARKVRVRWNPRMKGEFPMAAAVLQTDVFPAFGVDMPGLKRDTYTLEQYLDEIIKPHPQLLAVQVFKRRFAFTVNGCITEMAHLLVNGAAIQTVAVELEDVDAVLEAMEMLGLTAYENVNYLLAIKRITGLAPLPT